MAIPTLSDLLATVTVEQLYAIILAVYKAQGFPVESWQEGGVERTRAMAIATALSDVSANYVPQIAGGGFLDYAPNTPGWMPLLAQQVYDLEQNPATYTEGTITLTSASGVGTATYAAGKLIATFADTGNRYLNQSAVTIAAGPGSVSGTFVAESPGASYADASGSGVLTLVTPIPGVTLTNPAGDYTEVAHVGAGTGTLTLGGSPVGPHQVIIRIDSTGAVGVASWSYSLDGGAFTSAGTVATVSNMGGTGIDVTLVDGVSGTSFVLHDDYTFGTPGTWITQQGSDEETAAALANRCRERWASLSQIPVTGLYELLATSTPSVGSQVTQVEVVPDANINGKVNIVVAGPAGPLPPAAVTSIQSYIDPRAPMGDYPLVQSPTTTAITYAATVTVSASQLSAAQNAIETSLNDYTAGIGINGTLRIAAVIELVMEVGGVVDVSGVTINGSGSNLTLGSSTSFVMPAYPPTISFSYITV